MPIAATKYAVLSRKFLLYGLILLQVFLLRTTTKALPSLPIGSLTLAWDASGDPSVTGYRLYQGTQSQVYTSVMDASNSTAVTINGLVPGGTYYFAVTAYDSTGLESAFSGEISYTVPTSSVLPPSAGGQISVSVDSFNQAMVTGLVPVGVYAVMATEDVSNWFSIGTVSTDANGNFEFTDPASPTTPFRLYRLQQITTQPSAASSVSGIGSWPTPAPAGL